MDSKTICGTLIIVIATLALLFIPLFCQNSPKSEEETWINNSSLLDCFLEEPTIYLPILERMEDLFYWTLVYSEIKGIPYMKELFTNKLLACGIEEAGLDAIFRLLKAYSIPIAYEWIKPIISRIIEISSNRPEWFARNLILRNDRGEIARLIIKGDFENLVGHRKGLKEVLSELDDSEVKKELMEVFLEIEGDNRRDLENISEFMRNPAKDLDKIRDTYDICTTLGPVYRDNSFDILISWIAKDPDERKVAILFHFMNHCDGAYHWEWLGSTAVYFCLRHQPLFVLALEKIPNWKMIVYRIARRLNEEDKDFGQTFRTLGTSDFEIRLKSQLEFLRKHIMHRSRFD
jgi:hypothetical protein